MDSHRFTPAAPNEDVVCGACRPDYPSDTPSEEAVEEWIDFMHENDIERVCCLLDDKLRYYDGLLDRYRTEFGDDRVCHAPITDYCVVSRQTLQEVILPFLQKAEQNSERVVVHCSAGMGRTGHVLALWLVHERGYELEEAIQEVEQMGRNPLEATTMEKLEQLCR